MALPLFVVLALAVAVAAGVVSRAADPVVGMGFALVMAVAGGSILIGVTGSDVRLLGGTLLVVAVVSATAVLASSRRTSSAASVEERQGASGV